MGQSYKETPVLIARREYKTAAMQIEDLSVAEMAGREHNDASRLDASTGDRDMTVNAAEVSLRRREFGGVSA
jgi:hypothetical protein